MKTFKKIPWEIEKHSKPILDSVYKIHTTLGPGLLESVYEMCLAHELAKRGIKCERQVPLPVIYDNIKMEGGFRVDVLVENCVIVELKSIDLLLPVHESQVLTYLKLSNLRLGFLLNFNVPSMKRGIKRLVL
jgi:GxxExxY protein